MIIFAKKFTQSHEYHEINNYFFLHCIILLSACSTTRVPKYTTLKDISELELGISVSEAKSDLGLQPYNVLFDQKYGYKILQYKYKLNERKIRTKLVNIPGHEQEGTERYNWREQNLFLFFKSNKLEMFITSEGRSQGADLELINNTLLELATNKEKHFEIPSIKGE